VANAGGEAREVRATLKAIHRPFYPEIAGACNVNTGSGAAGAVMVGSVRAVVLVRNLIMSEVGAAWALVGVAVA
jgi:hypothetical protein